MRRGDFFGLLAWLRTNLHQHGRKFEPRELVQMITGGSIDPSAYLEYLENKFTGGLRVTRVRGGCQRPL